MSEKGTRYLGQLDQALCNGSWSEIPELARKTEKHAPERKCFTLAARSEAQIASASHRPTSASSSVSSSIHGLGDLEPKLKDAIEAEKKHPEDAYVARVCIAEILWLRDDTDGALQALASKGGTGTQARGSHVAPLGWIEVCDVKAALIEVAVLETRGSEEEARRLYLSSALKVPGSRTAELRRWTERLLAHGCMFMKRRAESSPSIHSLSEALRCFLAWTDFWQRSPNPTPTSSSGSSSPAYLDIPRRQVWKAYYNLLSTILQHDLMYNPSSTSPSDILIPSSAADELSDEEFISSKSRQRASMKRVEATYEALLLNETQFPKASQTNTEVEEWTAQVFSNWKRFCSWQWTDVELGEGGKGSVGRGVLDILYRSATKTFHSTSILRQLFYVHAALGEFELAIHAFNSFVELVDKAKTRAEKTGKHELGFDTNDSVVLTAAEAVRVLCRYGDREQGEKAIKMAETIRKWLGRDLPDSPNDANTSTEDKTGVAAESSSQPTESKLKSETLAAAYRALGTSKAHWAGLTYEADSRSVLQAEALKDLQRAQGYDEDSLQTAFSLALLLAEKREVQEAVNVIKHAIATSASTNGQEEAEELEGDWSRERKLIPLWHLLALCLTAKDDHDQAAKVCEIAFDQFGDAAVLFGDGSTRMSNDTDEKPSPRSSRGLVDQMDGFEKGSLLQVKMSQLTLLELMEGAEAAVDLSQELLALYGRLFGTPELIQPTPKPPPTAASATPSKFGDTIRSLAGSIRPKSVRGSVEKDTYGHDSINSSPRQPKPDSHREATNGQAIGVPIAITVTNEDGVSTEKSKMRPGQEQHDQHQFPFKLRGHHGDWREHGNLKPSKSAENMREKVASIPEDRVAPPLTDSVANGGAGPTPAIQPAVTSDGPANPEQPLKEFDHNAPHDAWPPPPGHADQPPRQDIRLPAPHPASSGMSALDLTSTFSKAQDRQHSISLLVKVWLFIAGMYFRADLFDDATAATDEAFKLAESFEVEVGTEHSSARHFFEKGWAGGKSVDALWADVWAAKGDLASTQSQPFAAMEAYEHALSYFPDHADGIIGLSDILMDIYEEKIPAERPRPLLHALPGESPVPPPPRISPSSASQKGVSSSTTPIDTATKTKAKKKEDPTPAELNRLAARDRAYMLLSTLTRLGTGWDNSEAWYTLARAHELSKQVGKAKQALWWVVKLEENRPMRDWREVSAGGSTM